MLSNSTGNEINMSNNRDGSHTVTSEKKTMLFDAGSLTSLLKGNAAAKKVRIFTCMAESYVLNQLTYLFLFSIL